MNLPPEIRAAIGAPTHISRLESGATSTVWRVQAAGKTYVFKRLSRRQPSCGLAVDTHIRKVLAAQGGAVAAPVMQGADWALDAFVDGVHPLRGALPSAVPYARENLGAASWHQG